MFSKKLLKSQFKVLQRRYDPGSVGEAANARLKMRESRTLDQRKAKQKSPCCQSHAYTGCTSLGKLGTPVCTHGTVARLATPPRGVAYSISSLPFSGRSKLSARTTSPVTVV